MSRGKKKSVDSGIDVNIGKSLYIVFYKDYDEPGKLEPVAVYENVDDLIENELEDVQESMAFIYEVRVVERKNLVKVKKLVEKETWDIE